MILKTLVLIFFSFFLFILKNFCESKEVFVFSTNKNNWRKYEWDKITTIVSFGYLDDQLVEYAHQYGVKISYALNFYKNILYDASLVEEWVNKQIQFVVSNDLDGINIDFEDTISCQDNQAKEGFNLLMALLSLRGKNYKPDFQLSIDFAWSPMDIDSRCYDYKTMSTYADVVFVMSYDQRSQISSCVAWANSAYNLTEKGLKDFLAIGIPKEKLVLGVPWYGYDYHCLDYQYETNICRIREVPFRNVSCSDAAGVQVGYTDILNLLEFSSLSPPISSSSTFFFYSNVLKFVPYKNLLKNKTKLISKGWDKTALSPFFTYQIESTNEIHQVWFDNSLSLSLKYSLSLFHLDLGGIGFWEADSLKYDYKKNSKKSVKEMWTALIKF